MECLSHAVELTLLGGNILQRVDMVPGRGKCGTERTRRTVVASQTVRRPPDAPGLAGWRPTIQTLHSHPRRAAMDDDDLFLRVLGRGKLAFTVEGKTFLHVFRPRARGPTLQLKLPTEAPDHHLRVFVDGGELVFLVSAEKEEVKGAARHVGAVRIPLNEALAAVERDPSQEGPQVVMKRVWESSCTLVTPEIASRLWVVEGLVDDAFPFSNAPFEEGTTRVSAESVVGLAKVVCGDAFIGGRRKVGLIVNPSCNGDPVARDLLFPIAPLATPFGEIVGIAMKIVPAYTEVLGSGLRVVDAVRSVVQARTSFPIPRFPPAEVMVSDVVQTLHRQLVGLRDHALMRYPWDEGTPISCPGGTP